mgnify:CR=1 FL=1
MYFIYWNYDTDIVVHNNLYVRSILLITYTTILFSLCILIYRVVRSGHDFLVNVKSKTSPLVHYLKELCMLHTYRYSFQLCLFGIPQPVVLHMKRFFLSIELYFIAAMTSTDDALAIVVWLIATMCLSA